MGVSGAVCVIVKFPYMYSRSQQTFPISFCLVSVPFRNTFDLPFPFYSISSAFLRVGECPRQIARTKGFMG